MLRFSLAALAIAAASVLSHEAVAQEPADAATSPQPVRVLVRSFAAEDLERAVVLRGVAEAARRIEARAQTDGLVVSEPLRKGALISAGDVLCEIEIGGRQAQLDEAMARLAQAQTDAEASERLQEGGFSAAVTLAADRSALASAEAAVAAIELDMARLRIVAPFDGVLETDAAEMGALLQPGSVCAELIAIDPIRFVGFATEREVGALRRGAPASARLVDGRVIAAEITFIARAADPATRTFRVEATAPNPAALEGGQVRAGFSVELTLPVAAARGHFIPSSALTLDSEGRLGVRVVAESDDGPIARFKPVEIITDDPSGLWVGGLADDETIIIRGHEYVSDGAPITPVAATAARAD